jgi:hypothetical protein
MGVEEFKILDFYPPEDEKSTRVHAFFENLRGGRLTTTKCARCEQLLWPPRVVCPQCNSEELLWVDLPQHGKLYAFTSIVLGAPYGMHKDVPFVVGIVELEGVGLKIFSRIDDIEYEACEIGMTVALKIVELPDGRVFYRFQQARRTHPNASFSSSVFREAKTQCSDRVRGANACR